MHAILELGCDMNIPDLEIKCPGIFKLVWFVGAQGSPALESFLRDFHSSLSQSSLVAPSQFTFVL